MNNTQKIIVTHLSLSKAIRAIVRIENLRTEGWEVVRKRTLSNKFRNLADIYTLRKAA